MNLPQQNSQYVQMLNENIRALNQNLAAVDLKIDRLRERTNNSDRDSAAMLRAVIEFLSEKGLIEGDEDIRLLNKFHMRQIAKLDQEITEKNREITEKNREKQ